MADDEKKIFVDSDWKAEAAREKERLAEEEQSRGQEQLPDPSFAELLNMIALQVLVGLGLVSGPGGERVPPNMEVAKHFVDMLQILEDKTKNNLTAEEKQLLDSTLYELRLRYVQMAQGGGPAGPGGGAGPAGPGGGPSIVQ